MDRVIKWSSYIIGMLLCLMNNLTNSQTTENTITSTEEEYKIPETNFDCTERPAGFYADIDPKSNCKVYHFCNARNKKVSFSCPTGTLFHQQFLICAHAREVNCAASVKFYKVNKDALPTDSRNPSKTKHVTKSETVRTTKPTTTTTERVSETPPPPLPQVPSLPPEPIVPSSSAANRQQFPGQATRVPTPGPPRRFSSRFTTASLRQSLPKSDQTFLESTTENTEHVQVSSFSRFVPFNSRWSLPLLSSSEQSPNSIADFERIPVPITVSASSTPTSGSSWPNGRPNDRRFSPRITSTPTDSAETRPSSGDQVVLESTVSTSKPPRNTQDNELSVQFFNDFKFVDPKKPVNPKCPTCDPFFLDPGQCTPCVRIR